MSTATLIKKVSIVVAGAVAISVVSGESTQAITLDAGTWKYFDFFDIGQPTIPPSFEFTSPTTGDLLKVTDAFLQGDTFQVFDFGQLLGETSPVSINGNPLDYTSDPDTAFADLNYSRGVFFLTSGNHSITITPIKSPFEDGRGYVRRDPAPIPTPALLPGLVGMGIAALRQKQKREEGAERSKGWQRLF